MAAPTQTPTLASKFWAFVDKFPSILVEATSGLILVAVLLGIINLAAEHTRHAVLLGATAISLIYEFKYDKNPASKLKDLVERELGIIVFLGLAIWLKLA